MIFKLGAYASGQTEGMDSSARTMCVYRYPMPSAPEE